MILSEHEAAQLRPEMAAEALRQRRRQGLLRLHSRYGPPDRSAAQDDLC
jgi:hypothetical protein